MMDQEDKLIELKNKFDRDFCHGQDTREKASDDLVFYHVTQWDDAMIDDSQLAYRGQFDVLRKAGRQILSQLRENQVSIDFQPVDESREDGAEVLDGLYRTDDRQLSSEEAYSYATQDAVVCGFGAWELYTDYVSNRAGDDRQVIRRRFIPEAVNTVFWDANAKRLDKSDARHVSILTSYTEEGYKQLVEELTGEEPESINPSNFASPETSGNFFWVSGDKQIYVATIYEREKVEDVVITLTDIFNQQMKLLRSDLATAMDDLIDSGYSIIDERKIERWQVKRYICSGEMILDEAVIAGDQIPIVPMYGERAFVEGEEVFEGITRLAKDPQRLRNFQLSYLADIVSRSPRRKPIFTPEQLQGFEDMYSESGAENNYPYLLQNRFDASGNPLPMGAVGEMPEQPLPVALMTSIELSRQAVEDVANAGVPQDVADPDLSGKAVNALQQRIDQQAYIYQHNLKFAKRRDAEIYASMATEVYVQPRRVTLTAPDGTRKQVEIMQAVVDPMTGEMTVLNDLTNMEFDVYADIGVSYSSRKEQTIDRLSMMIQFMPPDDPLRNILIMKLVELTEGVNFEDVRQYARNQLLIQGIREPETEEELQLLQQSQQSQQQPDAAMVLAQAEMTKAQAAQMREQINMQKLQVDAADRDTKNQIDSFEAQTGRMKAQIEAQEAGATINNKQADTLNKQVDAQIKVQQARERDIQSMSTQDLMRLARGR